MKIVIIFFALLGILGWAFGVIAAAPENTVIRILDGDTVEIMGKGRKSYKVRLSGLDAPEKKQPYGKKSQQALAKLAFKKIVCVKGVKRDCYGRTIARLYVGNQDINAAMIEQGAAWVYRPYARGSTFTSFYKAETMAKNNKIGLWALNKPIPPWEWRRKSKNIF